MRLPEFIEENIDTIAFEWEDFAKTHIPAAAELDPKALKDHIEGILGAAVSDLRTPQSRKEQERKSRSLEERNGEESSQAQLHGGERADQGFSVPDVMAEFRALRASVLKLWTRRMEHPDHKDFEDMYRFNEAMDQALMESLVRSNGKIVEAKDVFLGILGHDLRNPLNAINGCVSLLQRSDVLSEDDRNLVTQVDISAGRIEDLTNNLLELARTRLGNGLQLFVEPADMASLCLAALKEFQASHPDASLDLKTEGNLKGEWDKSRITQVLSNLIGNALQHGRPDGPVTIRAYGESDQVCVDVHNEGPPIPLEARKNIFKSFKKPYKDSPSRSLGLGLYIAHEIVSDHKGIIDVQSTKEEGTTFKVCLPRNVKSPAR